MQIGKIIYPITTLGIGKRIGIWTRGCNRICPGCSNPELQVFDDRYEVTLSNLENELMKYSFDGVTITGGEPFLQSKELKELVEFFINHGIEDILIFTGFTKEELELRNDKNINYILNNISVLIDGPFDIKKPSKKNLIGSTNQNIHIINPLFKKRYSEYMKQDKKVQVFKFKNEVHFIGVPIENYDEQYRQILRRKAI